MMSSIANIFLDILTYFSVPATKNRADGVLQTSHSDRTLAQVARRVRLSIGYVKRQVGFSHIGLSSQLWHTTGNSSRIRQEVETCHPPSSKIGQETLILMRRALSGVHKMLTFLRRYPRRARLLLARPGLSWCRDYVCRLSQWLSVQCCYVFPASECCTQLHDI